MIEDDKSTSTYDQNEGVQSFVEGEGTQVEEPSESDDENTQKTRSIQ